MRKIKEVLRLKHQAGLSNRQIARSCVLSHVTVSTYLERAAQAGLTWPLPESIDEDQLHALLFGPPFSEALPVRPLPEMEYLHNELRHKGVTLQLLWEEYRANHPDGYGYTQFCTYYARWKETVEVSLRQTPGRAGRRPGYSIDCRPSRWRSPDAPDHGPVTGWPTLSTGSRCNRHGSPAP